MTDRDEQPIEVRREQRRQLINLVAVDGIMPLLADNEVDPIELISECLSAICLELVDVSIRAEQETGPALQATGAMLGGLFGMGTTSDDETMLGLYGAGVRMRQTIGYQ